MKNIKEHFEQLLYQQKKEEYNIFSVLHTPHDEARLHSRFIAFLLDSNASHHQGNIFFKLFLKEVLKTDFDIDNYQIKTEYQFIDILIHNNENAIIIENKIYSGDSNHKEDLENIEGFKLGYRGQLERYYKTISTGVNNKGVSVELHRNVIQVAYLTLTGNPPSKDSRGEMLIEPLSISYMHHISQWLNSCQKQIHPINNLLAQDIAQYHQLILKLTSDIEDATKNRKIIAQDINQAWELENQHHFFTQEKMAPIFNHIKWHTIADFFNELNIKLGKIDGYVLDSIPTPEQITKVAHNRGKSNEKLILRFFLNEIFLQIVNDNQGLTIVNISDSKWKEFSKPLNNIKFNNFHIKETFQLINNNNSSPDKPNSIDLIINELLHGNIKIDKDLRKKDK